MAVHRFVQSIKGFAPCALLAIASVAILIFSISKVAHSYFPSTNYKQIESGEKLVTSGRMNLPACTSCHGANGEGDTSAAIPRLAGLNAQYIKKQLEDFARDPVKTRVNIEPIARDYTKTPRTYSDLTVFTPGTRRHKVMNEIAQELTATEAEDIALYYSSLSFKAEPVPVSFEILERGEDLAQRGKPEYGLPACDSCHGDKGHGHGPDFPPLAGQPARYIINQINLWQTGQRDNDDLALMRHIANQLTDGDKENVAAYYSNQSFMVNVE